METKRGIVTTIILSIFLMFLVIPSASAKIIINTQPNSVYNLGDIIPVAVTISTATNTSGLLNMDLSCGSNKTNFYKNPFSGSQGTMESSLVLTKNIIGELKGTCTIMAFLGTDSTFTGNFEISDSITIQSNLSKTEFNPGENILVSGNAVKENGNPANGFVELSILDGNSSVLTQSRTVNNGAFSINITLPKDIKAGNYLLRIRVYEQDLSGDTTNSGFRDNNIYIKQVPTSLEIVFEASEVEPGTSVKVKAVLHDQTGVKIDSLAFLTIKNNNGKILNQIELSTDEFLEFPIAYNEAPFFWKVVAVSNKLTSESSFKILEKENASIGIINKTVLITNTGNIPYNKTVLVKIGDEPFNIDVFLKVDETKRWILTAPDGEYDVEIIADGKITGASVALTGSTVDVKKASASVGSLVRFPAAWIFILAVLGFVVFIFFKRGYQKSFVGYISSRVPKKGHKANASHTVDYVHIPKSAKAELALSIRGEKQDVSMITLKVKNMASIKHSHGREGGAGETLKKIIDFAESHKAATHESHDSIFFIFAPARTKTFRNEGNALKVAQKIKEILNEHNRLFKQKIDFGISLNYGTIIGKQEPDSFKFMGMGNLMMQSKKIASIADSDVLMGERIADRLRSIVKAEKHRKENMDVYSIREIKNHEEHEKFLRGFMKRMDQDKK